MILTTNRCILLVLIFKQFNNVTIHDYDLKSDLFSVWVRVSAKRSERKDGSDNESSRSRGGGRELI